MPGGGAGPEQMEAGGVVTRLLTLQSGHALYFLHYAIIRSFFHFSEFVYSLESTNLPSFLPLFSAPFSFLSPLYPTRQSIGHNILSHSWVAVLSRAIEVGLGPCPLGAQGWGLEDPAWPQERIPR